MLLINSVSGMKRKYTQNYFVNLSPRMQFKINCSKDSIRFLRCDHYSKRDVDKPGSLENYQLHDYQELTNIHNVNEIIKKNKNVIGIRFISMFSETIPWEKIKFEYLKNLTRLTLSGDDIGGSPKTPLILSNIIEQNKETLEYLSLSECQLTFLQKINFAPLTKLKTLKFFGTALKPFCDPFKSRDENEKIARENASKFVYKSLKELLGNILENNHKQLEELSFRAGRMPLQPVAPSLKKLENLESFTITGATMSNELLNEIRKNNKQLSNLCISMGEIETKEQEPFRIKGPVILNEGNLKITIYK